jgi:hypothetical protein
LGTDDMQRRRVGAARASPALSSDTRRCIAPGARLPPAGSGDCIRRRSSCRWAEDQVSGRDERKKPKGRNRHARSPTPSLLLRTPQRLWPSKVCVLSRLSSDRLSQTCRLLRRMLPAPFVCGSMYADRCMSGSEETAEIVGSPSRTRTCDKAVNSRFRKADIARHRPSFWRDNLLKALAKRRKSADVLLYVATYSDVEICYQPVAKR